MKSKDVKEEEVARVPIAFAMVKLMQTLPPHIMEANLPGCVFQSLPKRRRTYLWRACSNFLFPTRILIKVCVLLRNRFQEIRDVARGTLVRIVETLGCRFLHYLLKEMQAVLVKGYQVCAAGTRRHNAGGELQRDFLCRVVPGPRSDVHRVPAAVRPQSHPEGRRPGPLHEHADRRENPPPLQRRASSRASRHTPLPPSLQQVFNNELFGSVAEEKEVKGIVSKLMEARHSKSMDSYQLLARFCSRDSITKLLLPLKEAGLLPVSEVPPKMMTSQRATPLKND